MRPSAMMAALLLAACGSADGGGVQTDRMTQGLADLSDPNKDDAPLSDRMTEANASDFKAAGPVNTSGFDEAVPAEASPAAIGPEGDSLPGEAARMEERSSRAPAAYGSCSDGKRVCGDMDDCADAVFHLEQCGMTRLDRDHDGTPCEKICG